MNLVLVDKAYIVVLFEKLSSLFGKSCDCKLKTNKKMTTNPKLKIKRTLSQILHYTFTQPIKSGQCCIATCIYKYMRNIIKHNDYIYIYI